MKAKVKETMEAPSCCPELKAACDAFLKSIGTPDQKAKTAALIKELEEDVCTLDHVIPFFESPAGEAVLGKKGRTIGGNIGSAIGRNLLGTLTGKRK